jgi:hypothetical protein
MGGLVAHYAKIGINAVMRTNPKPDSSEWTNEAIRKAQMDDEFCKNMIEFKEEDTLPEEESRARWIVHMNGYYNMMGGTLYYTGLTSLSRDVDIPPRIEVPRTFRDQLLKEVHDNPTGGHFKTQKMLSKLEVRYHWTNMLRDVTTYWQSCVVCAERSGQGAPYHPPHGFATNTEGTLGGGGYGHIEGDFDYRG